MAEHALKETVLTSDADAQSPWEPWLGRLAASRRRRDQKIDIWQQNVQKRVKSPDSNTTSSLAEVSVNQDWPKTKAKIAQLFSQVPEVRLTVRRGMEPMLGGATEPFGRELNETLEGMSIGSTLEEVLCDVINAAGIGAVLVTCEKKLEVKQVPEVDPATLPPDIQQAVMTGQFEIPMTDVTHVADIQYLGERISASDLLVPSDFTRSNYDLARWLARDGRMTWVQAVRELGLTEDQKEDVLGRDKRVQQNNSLNSDNYKFRDTEVVNFTEVFYWRHYYHAEETSFKAIQRLVFVDGLDEPVINEPYQAQTKDPHTGMMIGVTRLPIRVLTLTYISDESLPPSDSSISRYTVNELEDSRNDMRLQRKHSIPIRWGDSNRISPNARKRIDDGDFQTFIWTNGPGDRAVGEVARAAFPPEKFEFDRIAKQELSELWQVGDNQAGAFATGERSAREAGIIEQNFQRRVGQEQDKVQKFFLGIAEVLAGHLAMYGTFDLPDEIGPEMRQMLGNAFTYSVRVDSTVRLDANQQIARLEKVIDRTAQSPYVNAAPLLSDWFELNGIDPRRVLIQPKEKPPDPPNLSLKGEDLMNPMAVATMFHNNQGPSPDDLTAAANAIKTAVALSAGMPAAQQAMQPQPPDDRPPREGESPGIANPDWQMAPRQDKRDEDGGL